MKTFNLKEELELLGYTAKDKSQDGLSTNGDIAIYYYVDNYIGDNGEPIGMVIERGIHLEQRLFEGKMPKDKKELIDILTNIGVL
ncbi:hypothetical protein DW932_18295 [Bacteroides intestinalis]|jgi:hypothetical protein|uniref:hypothetical protein n=1 Tax=Bacteroides intestinalis TaxID=329854 RepID=UPI000E54AF79|nr:hypothetical protein [Bacteroides intestinalis]RHA57660.1 hypothetical protein DW932_18295 [Bacteroides intestinalis]